MEQIAKRNDSYSMEWFLRALLWYEHWLENIPPHWMDINEDIEEVQKWTKNQSQGWMNQRWTWILTKCKHLGYHFFCPSIWIMRAIFLLIRADKSHHQRASCLHQQGKRAWDTHHHGQFDNHVQYFVHDWEKCSIKRSCSITFEGILQTQARVHPLWWKHYHPFIHTTSSFSYQMTEKKDASKSLGLMLESKKDELMMASSKRKIWHFFYSIFLSLHMLNRFHSLFARKSYCLRL